MEESAATTSPEAQAATGEKTRTRVSFLNKHFFAKTQILEILAGVGAIQTVQKSSKSEPSSRFFGRLKFWEKFPRGKF